MTIDIFIINLERSKKRKDNILRKLDESGVQAVFFKAIDYMQDDFEQLSSRYNDSLRKKIYGNSLAPGEIACYASHYSLWEKCVELNKPIVILEDDIILNENFSDGMLKVEEIIYEYEYLRLCEIFKEPRVSVRMLDRKFELIRYLKGPRGTQAYALSPDGANKLLAQSKDWIMAVDHYVDMSWLHGLASYALAPLPVLNGSYDSDIGSKKQQYLNIWQKLKRELFAGYRKVRSGIFNLNMHFREFKS